VNVTSFHYQRHFTPAEATAMLPTVRAWLTELRVEVRRAQGLSGELRAGEAADPRAADKLESQRAVVAALLGRFHEEGIEVRALEPALIDFPALFQGREVLLCWREPEEAITHWHPLTTGYAGRAEISPEQASQFEWCN
jgi:hypothetical protein